MKPESTITKSQQQKQLNANCECCSCIGLNSWYEFFPGTEIPKPQTNLNVNLLSRFQKGDVTL